MTPPGLPLEQRFWAKVDRRGPDECWLWTGARNARGYGVIRNGDRTMLAHRVSLIIARRDPGPVSRHSCDNPPCVNPAHLKAGTQAENVADAAVQGRYRGEQNGAAKLTAADVAAIRERCSNGDRQADVAAAFGVVRPVISAIVNRRRWDHAA